MYNRQLDTFIQVVDSGSFAKASEKLFISTVSVMKQINALENSMDVKLLERTNQGVYLTSAGYSVYTDAKDIIRKSQNAVKRAREIANKESNTIRIGSSQLRPHSIMMDRWLEIDDGNLPFQIKIVPFSDDTTDINSSLKLLGKEYDCVVSPCDPKLWHNSYNMLIFKTEPYCLAISRKHPLAQKEKLSWDDLKGQTLMLLARGLSSEIDPLRDEIEKEHPDITIIDAPRSYTAETFNQCAQMNYFLGSPGIWSGIHPSLTTIPVDWNCKTYYGIVYEKEPPEKMRAFIAALSKQK